MRFGRKKTLLFSLLLILLSATACVGVLLGLDLYLHHRFSKAAGLNWRGYRGPVLSRKKPGEVRVAVVGGSTVLGYGVKYEESFPAVLQDLLNARLKAGKASYFVSVANLGFNGQGAYGSRYALEDYASLDYDVVVIYDGYNDYYQVRNWSEGRRESPLFRLTGYYFILPSILREKAVYLRGGYDADTAVYRPNALEESQAKVLNATADVTSKIEAYLARLPIDAAKGEKQMITEAEGAPTGCGAKWGVFCKSIERTVLYARGLGKKVLLVGIPYRSQDQYSQLETLEAFARRRFSEDSLVHWINLGRAVDLGHTALAFDGCHLTYEGNRIIADKLVEPVMALLPKTVGRAK